MRRRLKQREKNVELDSPLNKYFKKMKLIVKYPKYKLYYLLAKYYEKRALRARIFNFVLNYNYKMGVLKKINKDESAE